MNNNEIVQLKSYDDKTGQETGNVLPITNSEAVKVKNNKKLTEILTELDNRIDQTNSSLDNIEKVINYREYAKRAYGVYCEGDYNDYNKEKLKKDINDAIKSNCDSLVIYIDINVDDINSTYNKNLNDTCNFYNSIIEVINQKDWSDLVLRCGNGSKNINNIENYFKLVKQKFDYLLNNLNFDFDTIVIANESPNTTTKQEYKNYWLDIIRYLKSNYNIKVSMSCTTDEILNVDKEILKELDYFGFNMYPSLSYDSKIINEDYQTMSLRFKNKLKKYISYARELNKEAVIYEIGSHPALYNYMHPGNWVGTAQKDIDSCLIWWKIVLDVLENEKYINMYTMFYTPLKYEKINNYITNLFKRKVN